MELFAVTRVDVFPHQCVLVTDCKTYAGEVLSDFENHFPSVEFRLQLVSDFYPDGMQEADNSILLRLDQFQKERRVN